MYRSKQVLESFQGVFTNAAVIGCLLTGGLPASTMAGDDHGDSCTGASIVSLNDWTVGYFEVPGDRDVFRLEIEQSGILVVEIMDLGQDIGRPSLELLGAACNSEPGSAARPHGRGLIHGVQTAGFFYVQVTEQAAVTDAPYRLQVGFSADEDRQLVAQWPRVSRHQSLVIDHRRGGLFGSASDSQNALPRFEKLYRHAKLPRLNRKGSVSDQTTGGGQDDRFEEDMDEWEEVSATPCIPLNPYDYTPYSLTGNPGLGRATAESSGDGDRFKEDMDEWEEVTVNSDFPSAGAPFCDPPWPLEPTHRQVAANNSGDGRFEEDMGRWEEAAFWYDPAWDGATPTTGLFRLAPSTDHGPRWMGADSKQAVIMEIGQQGIFLRERPSERAHFYQTCPRLEPDDHGESFACSTALRLDSSRPGELRHGAFADRDTFSLVIPSRQTVILESLGDADTNAQLFDSSGARLLTDDNGGVGLNFRMVTTLGPGLYFLRVESVGWSEGSYQVQATAALGVGQGAVWEDAD